MCDGGRQRHYFNPCATRRTLRRAEQEAHQDPEISTHAPRVGRFDPSQHRDELYGISTHVSRVGRFTSLPAECTPMRFQPMRPAWDASTTRGTPGLPRTDFNPCAPRGTLPGNTPQILPLIRDFNPCAPRETLHDRLVVGGDPGNISTHAPRVGRFSGSVRQPAQTPHFNPCAPRGTPRKP